MRKFSILFTVLIILCIALPAKAATLFLDNWGVSPGNWTPSNAPSNTTWITEDFTGSGPGFLNPGWGGQPFDAEAAYIAFQNSKLYIAIVTGMPQTGSKDPWRYDNPSYNYHDWNQKLEKYWYDPGDIGIDLGADGTYEFAISTRPDNSHSSYAPTPGAGRLLSGNLVWENPKAWNYGSNYTNWNGVSNPWAVVAYDNALPLGMDFSYSAFGIDHYAIEAVINSSLLGLNNWDILKIHWVMECGNDSINLSADIPASIPEPSTLIMLGSGIAGIAFYKKRKRRKMQ
jgi:hypothetical protein